MKLTYLSSTFFPFVVPQKDASFASSVGAQTVYPAGFSLDEALQIYWRAQDYAIAATGTGTAGSRTQSLSASGNIPPRNASVATDAFGPLDGFAPTGPGDLVPGIGLQQIVTGSGTVTSSGTDGSGSGPAVFNLQVNLFYPRSAAPDPVVAYAGLWWPALSLSCQVTNTIPLETGGAVAIGYDCTTLADGVSTHLLGSFSFFGVAVPVYCQPLAAASGSDPAETRTFAGSLTVASEWA
jgi:hypothetical protein